jgi:nucleoside-diphosphate-sugar epimerase
MERISRRTFLGLGAGAIVAMRLGEAPRRRSTRLRILILGGRNFVGPAIVTAAVREGHEVTLFNRGLTNPALFASLPYIQGDRTLPGSQGLANLARTNWDVVIDTWPQDPDTVRKSTTFFKGLASHYVFVSTAAVYDDSNASDIDEEAALRDPRSANYGNQKVACENVVRDDFPDAHTIVRPGILVGDRNASFVFRSWLMRMKRRPEIVAPGDGDDTTQFIDVKDVAAFVLRALQHQLRGSYNTLRYPGLPFRALLQECRQYLRTNCRLVWIPKEFLLANGMQPFADIPMWGPRRQPARQISGRKALRDGLKLSPLASTVRDEMAWLDGHYPPDYRLGLSATDYSGMSDDRENVILAKWAVRPR